LSRGAVFERSGPRRIARDRSTDRRFLFARRVWRKKKSLGGSGPFNVTDQRAWPNPDRSGFDIEPRQAIERAERKKDSPISDGGSGGAGLCAGTRHWNSVGRRLSHQFYDFARRSWPRDQFRKHAQARCIGLVRLPNVFVFA